MQQNVLDLAAKRPPPGQIVPLSPIVAPDEHLQRILDREAVDTGPFSPVRKVQATLRPILSAWADRYLLGMHPSGSFAKGTANKSGTSLDLFILLSDSTPHTLRQLYEMLAIWMQKQGYAPKRRNMSINVHAAGYDVDLVTARQNTMDNGHTLYRRKADTWTKTNVVSHVNHVAASGRLDEIRILKLWRNMNRLAFPSFYLELTVIAALVDQTSSLAGNVTTVLEHLRDTFPTQRVTDPANPDNAISDDLTTAEKQKVRAAAERALQASNWADVIA